IDTPFIISAIESTINYSTFDFRRLFSYGSYTLSLYGYNVRN
ncbi:hypothetical protein CLAFUW4_08013, partial [Fulvia fulva]